MSLILDEHRQYLADAPRLAAFRAALREIVQPGSVVLDLGSGTGILGYLACQAGARRVYSVESTGMVELARQLSRANALDDRMVFVHGLSTHVNLPEKVDLIVSDQIGRFGFEAGLLDYFSDARNRLLKPGGALIPSGVEMCIAPVEHPSGFEQVEFWKAPVAGLDYRPAYTIAANTGYPFAFEPGQLLGDPATLVSHSLQTVAAEPFGAEVAITISRDGVLHGVGGWFLARLSPGVTMTNSPLAEQRINRRNVFFPIGEAVPVAKGEVVRIRIQVIPQDTIISWRVQVRDRTFSHSTWKGLLVCEEELRRTQPDFAPRLTARGQGRATVLQLCDGHRPLSEIEAEVWRRHRDLFHSEQEAALFVAEVVTRYSE